MSGNSNRRIFLIALAVLALDQATKLVVRSLLNLGQEYVVLDGFFKFVHWENTGAAFSFFHNRNDPLAAVSVLALVGLFFWRRHFHIQNILGQISLGLIFGGIAGNLTDRVRFHKVIDFLRFYLNRRGGEEIGFPAFNMADSAICIGVGLLILISWKQEHENANGRAAAKPASVP
jgi:signal peptidase II